MERKMKPNSEEMKIYSRFITEIRTYSHILNESAFAVLMRKEPLTRVFAVREDRFKLEIVMTEQMKKVNTDYFGYGFGVSSNFLMAINIASLGHFAWYPTSNTFWSCEHIGPSGKKEQVFLQPKKLPFPASKSTLTENQVKNAVLIAASLMREGEQNFRREYLKGIVHLDMGIVDLIFNREAFANFYRSFEFFMTTRVLKKKKLANELKELQEGIRLLGLPKEICEEFRNLYKIRSEQIMHAQQVPREITGEDILKIKVFTDYALHKYYRSKADEWLDQRRKDI